MRKDSCGRHFIHGGNACRGATAEPVTIISAAFLTSSEYAMAAEVHVSSHPLVLHRLAQLRHRDTDSPTFRRLVRELAQMVFFEAAADLRLKACTVTTPLADCTGHKLADAIGLVPILRAGLGMAEAILDLVPHAQVWHLGLYRDHETRKPVTYYNKLPVEHDRDLCFVVDPMLATGGSAVAAIDILKKWGLSGIKYLALIAAPEGVRTLHEAHADVPVFLAALDSHLDDNSYIVPGLGDAGDRQFGTW
jgi:uracil phosphoribosyltransferase